MKLAISGMEIPPQNIFPTPEHKFGIRFAVGEKVTSRPYPKDGDISLLFGRV